MIREKAIARLKVLTDYEYDEDLESLEMAIKALEQEEKLKEAIRKIKEEIQEKINQEIYSDGTPSEYAYCYDSVLDIIDNHLKGVEDFHEPDIRDETELER